MKKPKRFTKRDREYQSLGIIGPNDKIDEWYFQVEVCETPFQKMIKWVRKAFVYTFFAVCGVTAAVVVGLFAMFFVVATSTDKYGRNTFNPNWTPLP